MDVILATTSGFCFGVEDAIELAEKTLEEHKGRPVYSLGQVIHNKQVVEKLGRSGLRTVEDLSGVEAGQTVLIRSHGVPPSVIQDALKRQLNVVDATCVLVKRAQRLVKKLHEEGYQVVLVGDPDHPEVKGVVGYAPTVIVVDTESDFHMLPKYGKLGVVSQTTHSAAKFGQMVGKIVGTGQFREVKVLNTLCSEVTSRQEAAVGVAKQVDVMFVLGGANSANTKELARLCKLQQVPTHHLQSWADFHPAMTTGKKLAGVTAGASTPSSIIDHFVKQLEAHEPSASAPPVQDASGFSSGQPVEL